MPWALSSVGTTSCFIPFVDPRRRGSCVKIISELKSEQLPDDPPAATAPANRSSATHEPRPPLEGGALRTPAVGREVIECSTGS
jgi:hypothetical protein